MRAIARVATAPADGEGVPTVDVEIALPGAPGLDAAPVVVEVRRVLAADALTVPVGALLALTGTGYAVERVGAGRVARAGRRPAGGVRGRAGGGDGSAGGR